MFKDCRTEIKTSSVLEYSHNYKGASVDDVWLVLCSWSKLHHDKRDDGS